MRLIDVDAFNDRLDRCVLINGLGLEPVMAIRDIKALLSVIPTVEAEPVVHGRWMTCEDGWGDLHYQCSECGCEWFLENGSPADNGMNYCPHCGAKMDE